MNNTKTNLIKLALTLGFIFNSSLSMASDTDKLSQAIAGKHRTAEYVARDQYRHPLETLNFFGINESMTVVEISPGGGWYTEILAPYLKDKGVYVASGYDPASTSEYFSNNAKKFIDKLAANKDVYGKTLVTVMQPPEKIEIYKDNSADLILSFRNTHNWNRKGHAELVYSAIFKALKPGGTFGLVQHRANPKNTKDTTGKLGYLLETDVIALAEKAGFKLAEKSEINANPKDTADYEGGVWTLPPAYGNKDKDRAVYEAIGESDRMTLKFVKPAK